MYVTLIGFTVVLISVSFGFPVPAPTPLLMPTTAARVQAKVVPAVPLVGVYENTVLLHIAGGVSALVSIGIGLTVTTTLNVEGFVHPLAVRV